MFYSVRRKVETLHDTALRVKQFNRYSACCCHILKETDENEKEKEAEKQKNL